MNLTFAVYMVFTSTACPHMIDHSQAEQEKNALEKEQLAWSRSLFFQKKKNRGHKNCVNSNFPSYSYLTRGITIKVVLAHSLSLKFINIV